MALRVLLADESTTIKKVIQLALQDLGVDVKSVHSGLEVIEVAKQYQPNIIMADVLLQKRSGYDVCADIKADPSLSQIPVILLWSSFMEIDERAYQNSKANDRLEKPFEVDDLRKMVQKYTQNKADTGSKLSGFLKKPAATNPENSQSQAPIIKPPSLAQESSSGISQFLKKPVSNHNEPEYAHLPPLPSKEKALPADQDSKWNMDSFDDIESFSSVQATHSKVATPPGPPVITNAAPMDKALEDFKLDLADDEDPFSLMDLNKKIPPPSSQVPQFKVDPKSESNFDLEIDEEMDFSSNRAPIASVNTKLATETSSYKQNFDAQNIKVDSALVEKIVREQTQIIVEKLIQKIVPEMAKAAIQQELDRLLSDELS